MTIIQIGLPRIPPGVPPACNKSAAIIDRFNSSR
jgi:hypothetical protein